MISRGWIWLFAGGALLLGLFLLMRPTDTPGTAPARDAPGMASSASPAAVAGPVNFSLLIEDGQRQSGPARMQVVEGDAVVITVTSNKRDELHLHGYDLKLALKPDSPAALRFVADRSGRFEIELHHAKHAIGALEVYPAAR